MSDEVVASIHRQSKDFSFHPFAINAMANLVGLPRSITTILQHKMHEEDGFMKAWSGLLRNSLSPGALLNDMLGSGVEELNIAMHEALPATMSLRSWIENLVVCVGAVAFWGPENPFATDPSLVQTNK